MEQIGTWDRLLKNLATDDSGQDLIEYSLVAGLAGLDSAAAIGGLHILPVARSTKLQRAAKLQLTQ